MDQEQLVVALPAEPGSLPEKRTISRLAAKIGLEGFAIIAWSYAIAKIFVFDIDRFLMEHLAPSFVWVLNFRLLFFLSFLVALVWFGRQRGLIPKILYVAFYPGIILFWKIPFFVVRQRSWVVVLAFVNAIIAFFGSFRYNVTVAALFLTSSAVVLFSRNRYLLWPAGIILFALLTSAYVRRLIYVFKPSAVFRAYEKIMEFTPRFRTFTFTLDQNIKEVPYKELSGEQAEKWKSNLTGSIMLSRGTLFAAKKLRDYGRSGLGKISSVFISLFLAVATVMIFTLINVALWKIDPGNFRTTAEPGFSSFFDYSFNRMAFDRVDELIAATPVAKTVFNLQAAFVYFLGAILVSLLISTRTERQTRELNEAIEKISAEAGSLERTVLVEYRFNSIEEAFDALDELQAGTASFLRKLSASL